MDEGDEAEAPKPHSTKSTKKDDPQSKKSQRYKAPTPPADDVHQAILAILKGNGPHRSHRTATHDKAYKKIERNSLYLKDEHFNPLLGKKAECIMFKPSTVANVLPTILPPNSDVEKIVKMYHESSVKDNAEKLYDRIRFIYCGISKTVIQQCINKNAEHAEVDPIWPNKPPTKPIVAHLGPMHINQGDLVNLTQYAVKKKGKVYKYVLAVLDVFSRFLWLRPLTDKYAHDVADELYNIYVEFGAPRVFQSDQGTEFKQEVELLCSKLQARVIHGRPRHPQSQGKIERSHGTWKRKVRTHLLNAANNPKADYTWIDWLAGYARIYNEGKHSSLGASPFEVFFGRKPNRLETFAPNMAEMEEMEMEVDEIDTHEDWQAFEKRIDEHFEAVQFLRETARDKDEHVTNKMTKKLMKKRPPSRYYEGDAILIKIKHGDEGLKKGKSKLRLPKSKRGIVIEADHDNYRYRVKLQGEQQAKWYTVDEITMRSRHEERQKQAEAHKKPNMPKHCECDNPECARMPALQCTYNMHHLCCKRYAKKPAACALKYHNDPQQKWIDFKETVNKHKFDTEEQSQNYIPWHVKGWHTFLTMQATMLAAYNEARKKKNGKTAAGNGKNTEEKKQEKQQRQQQQQQKQQQEVNHRQLMLQRAQEKNFIPIDCGSRGDCMFTSLSHQLEWRHGVNLSAREIRLKALEYVGRYPNIQASDDPITDYIILPEAGQKKVEKLQGKYKQKMIMNLYQEYMRKDSTWGDHIMLLAAATELKLNIQIISHDESFDFLLEGGADDSARVTLGHIWERHYVSLIPEDDECPASPASTHSPSHSQADSNDVGQADSPPPTPREDSPPPPAMTMEADWEDVEEFINSEIDLEMAQPQHTEYADAEDFAKASPGVTPVAMNHLAIKIFLRQQRALGIVFPELSWPWGDFVCLTEDQMGEYMRLRSTLRMDRLVELTKPFIFFLSKHKADTTLTDIIQVYDDIWEVPEDLKAEFTEWYEEQKSYVQGPQILQ